MGIGDWLRGALGGLAPAALPSAEEVAERVPPDAAYVTAGLVDVLPDAAGLLGDRPGRAAHRRATGWSPPAAAQPAPGLLVLAGTRLTVLRSTGPDWVTDVGEVTDLAAYRPTGFLLVAADGAGFLASAQVPVEVPPGATWQTVGRVSNVFGGWDGRLRPFGTRVHA